MATLRFEPPLEERRKTPRVQRVDGATKVEELVSSILRNAVRFHIASGKPIKEFQFSLIQPAESYDPQSLRETVTGYVKVTMNVIAVNRGSDTLNPDTK